MIESPWPAALVQQRLSGTALSNVSGGLRLPGQLRIDAYLLGRSYTKSGNCREPRNTVAISTVPSQSR